MFFYGILGDFKREFCNLRIWPWIKKTFSGGERGNEPAQK